MTGKHGANSSEPGLIFSLIPVLILIIFLITTVIIFKDDAVAGPTQVALVAAGFIAALLAIFRGAHWHDLEKAVIHSIGYVTQTFLILLLVGALIGTWMLGGIVPSLIVYGLELISPRFYLPASVIISGLIAFATGSSWSTAGTIGIALMGIGNAMGINPAMSAGAVISGAYFGDKMSPFSETTNLSSSMVGTELFVHIRHMLYTTGPALVITIVLFIIIGLNLDHGQFSSEKIQLVTTTIESNFNISLLMLLPMVFLVVMIGFKIPAIPALIAGSAMGVIMAVFFQAQVVTSFIEQPADSYAMTAVTASLKASASGFTIDSGINEVDKLLSRGGMNSMLTTIWLILAAMFYSGIMEGSGMLQKIGSTIIAYARTRGNLIAASIFTAIFANFTTSDQYMSIVVTGRMYDGAYRKQGLHSKNLSRVLEDAGTLTSALVPWNTCGAFMASTLGVATLAYLPFAFLNLLNPLISLIYGYTGFSIARVKETEEEIIE